MTDSNRVISARQQFLNSDGTVASQWFRFLEALASQSNINVQFTAQDALLLSSEGATDSVAQSKADDALLIALLNDGE